ncbi:uncharacterized protein PAC_00979 [Phialocephala subalpina]|uniref:BTB domain-containing protein n=1 Tax=Phialocephala subalpina TaxID=576137 RepID=A0A1L7WEC2_9HELO|nr:uncharacterized protein PAC_00979 [Phialocephala subalpina]
MLSKTPEKRKSSARIIASPSPKKNKMSAFRAWASSIDTNKIKKPSQQVGGIRIKKEKNKPFLSDGDAHVTFIIGPEDNTEKFTVPKKLACFYSSVLNAALNGDSVEHQTHYRIIDTTSRAFQILHGWLFNEELMTKQLSPPPDMDLDDEDYGEEDKSLAELWVLAEKLSIPTLQNAAIEAITRIAVEHSCAPEATFDYVYNNTQGEESPLRRLLVRQCIEYTDLTLFVENKD